MNGAEEERKEGTGVGLGGRQGFLMSSFLCNSDIWQTDGRLVDYVNTSTNVDRIVCTVRCPA